MRLTKLLIPSLGFINAINAKLVVRSSAGNFDFEDYTLTLASKSGWGNVTWDDTTPISDVRIAPLPHNLDACQPLQAPPAAMAEDGTQKSLVVFTADYCDTVVALQNLERYGVKVALHLVEPRSTKQFSDLPERYFYSPAGLSQRMIVNRLSDVGSQVLLRSALGCNKDGEYCVALPEDRSNTTLGAFASQLNESPSPWIATFTGPMWGAYVILGLLYYIWMGQHLARCIHLGYSYGQYEYGSEVSLQNTCLVILLLLAICRFAEFMGNLVRDLGQTWVPDMFGLMLYFWGYCFALLALGMLILFWAEVIRNQSRQLINLSQPSRRLVRNVLIGTFFWVTLCVMLSTIGVSKVLFIFLALFWLVAIAMVELYALIKYGGSLLRRLAQMENQNGSQQRRKLKITGLTRLVIASASFLFFGLFTVLIGIPNVEGLTIPDNIAVAFFFIFLIEASTYTLLIYTISPLFNKQQLKGSRKKGSKTESIHSSSVASAMSSASKVKAGIIAAIHRHSPALRIGTRQFSSSSISSTPENANTSERRSSFDTSHDDSTHNEGMPRRLVIVEDLVPSVPNTFKLEGKFGSRGSMNSDVANPPSKLSRNTEDIL